MFLPHLSQAALTSSQTLIFKTLALQREVFYSRPSPQHHLSTANLANRLDPVPLGKLLHLSEPPDVGGLD